jgi:hypothetical protein
VKNTASQSSSAGTADRRGDQVYSITSASTGHSDELGARELRYALSMGLRTACFVGGVAVWNHVLWLGILLFVGAVFLPYTSVILANAGVRSKAEGSDLMKPEPYGEIGDGSGPRA